MKHRHCRDADCICSGSGIDLTSESETKVNYPSKRLMRSLNHNQSIDALSLAENNPEIIEETKSELENTNVTLRQKENNILLFSPSLDLDNRSNAKTPSFYSADISEMSVLPNCDIIKLPTNQINQTNYANRKQKKKMRNSLPQNREESASPLSMVKLSPRRLRRKLKKRAPKKFNNVTIRYNKSKIGGPLCLILCYLAMHTTHWSLLACASFALPSLITTMMSSYHLLTNLICCVNPVVLGLCYAGQTSFRMRKLRSVRPLIPTPPKV
jgi:hypothetical protein